MKNNFSNNWLLVFLLFGVVSCNRNESGKHDGHHVPVDDTATISSLNKGIVSDINTIKAETGKKIVSVSLDGIVNYDTRKKTGISSRVGGRIEKLYVKYNFQRVNAGDKIMEIYSPELLSAQRELLMLQSTREVEMMNRAKQRLQLLGMRNQEIEQVLRSGRVLYSIPVYSNKTGYVIDNKTPDAEPSSNMPVLIREGEYVMAGQSLFSLYEKDRLVAEFYIPSDILSNVKKGQTLLYHVPTNVEEMHEGSIGLLEPVFKNGENFSRARIYLNNDKLKVGDLLKASLPLSYTGGWWLPTASVWRQGSKAIVFRKTTEGFYPYEVALKATLKDQVLISTDISEWMIASNAAYLVDSESFLNAKRTSNQYE